MHIINLTPLEPGVYNDHASDSITAPPEGWAYIPGDFPLPSTFPRLGSIKTEEQTYTYDENGSLIAITQTETGEVPNGVTIMTVTSMTEGTLPDPEPEPDQTLTMEERVASLETSKANKTAVDELADALDLLLSGATGEEATE